MHWFFLLLVVFLLVFCFSFFLFVDFVLVTWCMVVGFLASFGCCLFWGGCFVSCLVIGLVF